MLPKSIDGIYLAYYNNHACYAGRGETGPTEVVASSSPHRIDLSMMHHRPDFLFESRQTIAEQVDPRAFLQKVMHQANHLRELIRFVVSARLIPPRSALTPEAVETPESARERARQADLAAVERLPRA